MSLRHAAAQAGRSLRHAASPLARQQQVRHMSGSMGTVEEETANFKMWTNATIVGGLICGGVAAYQFSKPHQHFEKMPEYSYLRIRNKAFPWGDKSLFDFSKDDE